MNPVPIRLPRRRPPSRAECGEELVEKGCAAISEELTPRKSAAWRKKWPLTCCALSAGGQAAEVRRVRLPDDIPGRREAAPDV
ncbi:MAG: hypothetical protein ACLUEQ_03215 [Cloacibacillus evryensis]